MSGRSRGIILKILLFPLERNLYGHLLAGLLWKRQFEKSIDGTWLGESTKLWMLFRSQETQVIHIGLCGWHQIDQKEVEFSSNVRRKLMKNVDFEKATSILDQVYVGCTQRECKPNEKIIGQYNKMFESRISAGATENLPGWDTNLPRKQWRGPTTWKDVLKKCVERFCELANKKTEQLYKVSSPCLDDHHVNKEELESVGELSQVSYQIACTWHELVDLTFCGQSRNWHDLSQNGLKYATDDYFKTLICRGSWRHQAMFDVFLKVEHLNRSIGCTRSKRQYLTVQQNQRSYRWMLVCVWMVWLRSTCGIRSLMCWERLKRIPKQTQARTRETNVKTQSIPKIKQALDQNVDRREFTAPRKREDSRPYASIDAEQEIGPV